MTDIRIVQRGSEFEAVTLDWLLTPIGELDTSNELATAVTVALLTDRRAEPDDQLPDERSDDRRGWWGDLDAETLFGGWPIGSRLWLLSRAKITGVGSREGPLVARIEAYLDEAMQPFVDAGIATRHEVSVERIGNERIDGSVTLYRGNRAEVALRYQDLWSGIR